MCYIHVPTLRDECNHQYWKHDLIKINTKKRISVCLIATNFEMFTGKIYSELRLLLCTTSCFPWS